MDHKISNEQKAHDLAIAYTIHSLEGDKSIEAESFYQDYLAAYDHFLKFVNKY